MVGEIIMKQFNLEEYLEDTNRKIVTRNGDPVRIICTDAGSDHCIIALVRTEEEEEIPYSYYEDGKYLLCSDCVVIYSLLLIRKKARSRWVIE